MNTNVRIGFCVLGFFFPPLFAYMASPEHSSSQFKNNLQQAYIIGFFVALALFFFTRKSQSSNSHFNIVEEIDITTEILLYILSFFIPLAGFIVGAIYSAKEEETYKKVGRNCLIFSVINIVIGFIMIFVILGSM